VEDLERVLTVYQSKSKCRDVQEKIKIPTLAAKNAAKDGASALSQFFTESRPAYF
jgi:hypothetical protein